MTDKEQNQLYDTTGAQVQNDMDEMTKDMPEKDRRTFMKLTAMMVGAGVAGGGSMHPKSPVSPVGNAQAVPALLPVAYVAAGTLGLSVTAGAGFAIGGQIVNSTIDHVWGLLGEDEEVDEDGDEDDSGLNTAHINTTATANNLVRYQDRVIAGTTDQKRLTRSNALLEGLIAGLESKEDGSAQSTAESEGAVTVQDYYTRLEEIALADMEEMLYHEGGLLDQIELENEYEEEDVDREVLYVNSSLGSSIDDRQYTVVKEWDSLNSEIIDDSENDVDEIPEELYQGDDGEIMVEVPLPDGSTKEVQTIVGRHYATDSSHADEEGLVYLHKPLVDPVSEWNYDWHHRDLDEESFSVVDAGQWRDLGDAIDTQETEIRNMVQDAIANAYDADVDATELLNAFNSIVPEGDETNIQSIQIAFMSAVAGTQADARNTSIKFKDPSYDPETDDDGDNTITVRSTDGTTEKHADSMGYGVVSVTDRDVEIATWNVGETYDFDHMYFTNMEGNTFRVEQDVEVADIRRHETDEDGEQQFDDEGEPIFENLESVDHNDTDLETQDIERLEQQMDVIQEQQDEMQELLDRIEELEEDDGGGIGDPTGWDIPAWVFAIPVVGFIIGLFMAAKED